MNSTTAAPTGRVPAPSDRMRKVALYGGIAYLVTFVASIPQLGLYADLVDDPAAYVSGTGGSDTPVLLGSWLEIVTALACVATAVLLYPATRRVSRTAAIGFVGSRLVEAGLILVGAVTVLAVFTLKSDLSGVAGPQADALHVTAQALVDVRQWTFLVGPGLVPGVNALFLGYVMYRGGLVPRVLPIIGLIGAPLILLSATVTIFDGWEQTSPVAGLLALPIAAWELGLGLYLTFKGFKVAPDAPTAAGQVS